MPEKTNSNKPNFLQSMQAMLDDHLGKEEFVKAFEQVVTFVQKLEERLTRDFETVASTVTSLAQQVQQSFSTLETELREKVNTLFVQERLTAMETDVASAISRLDKRVASVRNGKDGERGPKGERGERGPKGEDGKDADVTDLKKELEDFKRRLAGMRTGARKTTYVKRVNLSSQVDGVTKTFTLPNDTIEVLGVWGTQFPINFNPGTDWTFAGRTLTLTDQVSAPQSGQTLYCLVESLFY